MQAFFWDGDKEIIIEGKYVAKGTSEPKQDALIVIRN